jgi:hypothetical protein
LRGQAFKAIIGRGISKFIFELIRSDDHTLMLAGEILMTDEVRSISILIISAAAVCLFFAYGVDGLCRWAVYGGEILERYHDQKKAP